MADTREREGVIRRAAAMTGASFSPWQRLALAFAVSLLAHAVLLSVLRLDRPAPPAPGLAMVTLRVVAPPPDRPVLGATPPAPPPVQPTQETQPVAPAPPAPGRSEAPQPRPPAPRPPAPAAPRVPVEALDAPPALQASPVADAAFPEIGSRRFELLLDIEADGSVRRAEIELPEVPAATIERLQALLRQLRFAPLRREGAPAGVELRGQLCFDRAGRVDPSRGEECLRLDAPPSR